MLRNVKRFLIIYFILKGLYQGNKIKTIINDININDTDRRNLLELNNKHMYDFLIVMAMVTSISIV